MVARAGTTTGKMVAEAIERLARTDARIAGTVLNRATAEAVERYSYGYRYADAKAAGAPKGSERPI
jgi:Mrp family chromosome partitioning ATPase